MSDNKQAVQDFWEDASCGENLYLGNIGESGYLDQSRRRYELEPFIEQFAAFDSVAGRKVLEIGVGLGADHQRFAERGALLTGIDLTERAIEHTKRRLELFDLKSDLSTADAENLPFNDSMFDVVYSWGVLHHSPDTPKAIKEVHRVLTPGGVARVMIYHKWSLVGYMLWLRFALARLRPWLSLSHIYSNYLESPGTKAYSTADARRLFRSFSKVKIATVLTHGDLLESEAGQRHRGRLLNIARKLWPRVLLRRVAAGHGLFLLVTAVK